jgi:hypothetical protein
LTVFSIHLDGPFEADDSDWSGLFIRLPTLQQLELVTQRMELDVEYSPLFGLTKSLRLEEQNEAGNVPLLLPYLKQLDISGKFVNNHALDILHDFVQRRYERTGASIKTVRISETSESQQDHCFSRGMRAQDWALGRKVGTRL